MVTYLDPGLVTDIRSDETAPRYGADQFGYGGKIPTRHWVRYAGRARRVYAACYSNVASVYVVVDGEHVVLDANTEWALSVNHGTEWHPITKGSE